MENTMLRKAEALAREAKDALNKAKEINEESKRLTEHAIKEVARNQAALEAVQRALKLRELDKLEFYCKGRGFNYTREDTILSPTYERHLVIVYDENQHRLWDAACSPGTYGYEQGKLEILGSIVFETDPDGGKGVVGWLTAEEVIERIERGNGKPDK